MKTWNSAAPGTFRRDERPPIESDSAPRSGAAEGHQRATGPRLRRTVRPRTVIWPAVWASSGRGYPVSSEYVRTFWTAVLGPGAVADLLRLATAAARGRSLLRPPTISALCAAGLTREHAGRLEVRAMVPPLPDHRLRSLHPAIRRLHQHARWREELVEASAA